MIKQTFSYVKGLVKRMKRQATEWEKIILGHISDKGFSSRIYKNSKKSAVEPKPIQLRNGQKT